MKFILLYVLKKLSTGKKTVHYLVITNKFKSIKINTINTKK